MRRVLILWLMVLCVGVTGARGDTLLSVDFGVSDPSTGNVGSPNDIALGFFDFSSPTGATSPDRFSTLLPIAKTFGTYEVEVLRTLSSNGIFYVDAGNMNSAGVLNDLLEDYVAEFGLGVRIRNLTPGNYTITSYHHLLDGTSATPFSVYRSVGALFNQVDTITGSFGQNPSQISQRTLSFSPDADGSVLFRYGNGLDRGYINGFSIASVPEPTSLALIIMLCTMIVILSKLRERMINIVFSYRN